MCINNTSIIQVKSSSAWIKRSYILSFLYHKTFDLFKVLLTWFALFQPGESKCWVRITAGEDEVWRAQHYVGESLQEAKVHQVGEEASSHHQHWEAFKHVETCQHSCRELGTFTTWTQASVICSAAVCSQKQVYKGDGSLKSGYLLTIIMYFIIRLVATVYSSISSAK